MSFFRPQHGIDTIDLQDRDAPSAKNHSHIKAHTPSIATTTVSSSPDGQRHLSPHQAETLRGVAAETAEDRRVSWNGSNLSNLHINAGNLAADIADSLNLSDQSQQSPIDLSDHIMASRQQQDALAVAQNGGLAAEAAEEDMDDVDDGLDDDMMEKISSSPSIDDGGYTQRFHPHPVSAPPRAQPGGSLPVSCQVYVARPTEPLILQPMALSLENAVPPRVSRDDSTRKASIASLEEPPPCQCRRHGGYNIDDLDELRFEVCNCDASACNGNGPHDVPPSGAISHVRVEIRDIQAIYSSQPAMDAADFAYSTMEAHYGAAEELFGNMSIPFVASDDSDSDDGYGALDLNSDPMFVISAWDSECLHNIEDIDFEFVYALHTFMATVEGQANATKGDTMVLLDDSNSYWWLVRVVKDSSIGRSRYAMLGNLTASLTTCQATSLQSTSRLPQNDWRGSTSIEISTYVWTSE